MDVYQVKSGDTLWKIARQHNTTVAELAALNRLGGAQLHELRIGQNLHLPDTENADPDTILTLSFKGLDFSCFTPKTVLVRHDDRNTTHTLDGPDPLRLRIRDHAMGLEVWLEDLDKSMAQVLSESVLPLGEWNLSIDSRQLKVEGNMLPKEGKAAASTVAISKSVAQTTQAAAKPVQEQTRTEAGKPVHALGTIYTSENLRLHKGNERYRALIVAAAKVHDLTPQSLAALIDAEAAPAEDGSWDEKSNSRHSDLAQGMAQFFPDAWTEVFNKSNTSLLKKECASLSPSAMLSKRLEARYAIDGAAALGVLNMRNFAKSTKYPVEALPAEDKAKLAYLLHHEGLKGVLRLCGQVTSMSADTATDRLAGQIGRGNVKKLREIIAQYDGDPVVAYRGWLFTLVDNRINVRNFIVKDEANFTGKSRTMGEILASLSNSPPPPPPKPKVAAPAKPKPASAPAPAPAPKGLQSAPPAKKLETAPGMQAPIAAPAPSGQAPSAAPAGNPAVEAVGNPDAVWCDPLKVCKLRTAGLGPVGARFGWTRNGGQQSHQGIDLIAAPGTPIYAVADGTVYMAPSTDPKYAYGNTLVLVVGIDDLPPVKALTFKNLNPHEKTIGFFYAHLEEFAFEKNGTPVHAGDVLGKSGCSGNAKNMKTVASGAHLHFEVRKKAKLKCGGLTNRANPLPFIEHLT